MKENKNGIISGLGWSYAERLLAQLVTLVVSIVLARLLSPEHYGIIAIVSVFISIGDAMVAGGFGNALVQKKDASEDDFNSICWLSIGIALALYVILFFTAPLIERFYETEELALIIRVMALKFVFSAFNSVQHAYVQKHMQFRKFFFSTLGGTIAASIVGITMAYSGMGVWSLVAQYMTNTIIDTVVLLFTIDWKPKLKLSVASIKNLWKFGIKTLCASLVDTLKDNFRTLIIGKKFSSSDLAYYNQGQKYPSLLVSDIVSSLGKVIFPVMSQLQDDVEKIKVMMRKSIQVSSFVLTPVMAGVFAVADTFVTTVLTDKWQPCVPFLRIMCIVYVTRSLSVIYQKSLLAIGKSGLVLIHEVITSVLTVVLVVVAVFGIGTVDSIAWSYVVVMLVGMAIYLVFGKKYLRYSFIEVMKDILPSYVVSTIMVCVVMAIDLIPINIYLKFAAQIISGITFYVGISILRKDESLSFILKYLKGLKNKKS